MRDGVTYLEVVPFPTSQVAPTNRTGTAPECKSS